LKNLEIRERINYLYDFYGELLTRRQQQILELYYNHDLSLGEISIETGISRQAVHDLLKRSSATLEKMEKKLGLWERHIAQQKELESVAALIRQADMAGPEGASLEKALVKITGLLEK
jgi:uncharacterized protein